MNNMIRALSENGGVVFCGVDSTNIVSQMEAYQHPSAVVTAGLGRLLTAASLIGIMMKNTEDSVTLRVEGDGPVGLLLAVGDGLGNVKGYAANPIVEIPPRADGHLNVGAAVGKGMLSVLRDLGLKEPYVGQVPLVSGEIAEDIASYYAISEQIPTVCALGVLVNPDLTVSCAGGFLLQLLPGASEEEISTLEKNIAAMPSMTTLLSQGKTPEDIMNLAMAGFNPNILDTYHVEYKCTCSEERVRRMLRSLGQKELIKLRDEDPIAEVKCQFCDKVYHVDLNELVEE